MMKNLFCSECGTPFNDISVWPRICGHCATHHWKNPKPVVCVLQPIYWEEENGAPRFGLASARRAIPPKLGEWSLIGGFMETGESVEDAAAREFREETSLELAGIPRIVFTCPVGGTVPEQLMLMTYVDKPLPKEVFMTGKPCSENFELGIYHRESVHELAFPSHQLAANCYFAGEYK